MALRFLVEEELELNSSLFTHHSSLERSSLLLTAYTHRAVDEICSMLEENGQDYLRLGSEANCDPRFAHRLLSNAFSEKPKLSDIRQRLESVPIVVSTTLTLMTRPFLLSLKHFSLCIVDEASQILEPYIVGLLSSDSIDRFKGACIQTSHTSLMNCSTSKSSCNQYPCPTSWKSAWTITSPQKMPSTTC